MENNIDLACFNFTKDLSNLINNSKLPVSVVYLIISDLLRELDNLRNKTIEELILKQNTEDVPENKAQ